VHERWQEVEDCSFPTWSDYCVAMNEAIAVLLALIMLIERTNASLSALTLLNIISLMI
jgi:hypothetical protein